MATNPKITTASATPGQYLKAYGALEPRKPGQLISPIAAPYIAAKEYEGAIEKEYAMPPDMLKEPIIKGYEQLSGKAFTTPEERNKFWEDIKSDPESRKFINQNMASFVQPPSSAMQTAQYKEEAKMVELPQETIDLGAQIGMKFDSTVKRPIAYAQALNGQLLSAIAKKDTNYNKAIKGWTDTLDKDTMLKFTGNYIQVPGSNEKPALTDTFKTISAYANNWNVRAKEAYTAYPKDAPQVEVVAGEPPPPTSGFMQNAYGQMQQFVGAREPQQFWLRYKNAGGIPSPAPPSSTSGSKIQNAGEFSITLPAKK